MSVSETFILGKTVVHLEAGKVLAPLAQPHVNFRIRLTGFDGSVNNEISHLHENIHCFRLGEIPLPTALPTIVSSVVAHLHDLHVDLRVLDDATVLKFSFLAAEQMQRTGGSTLELLVHVGLLLGPGGSGEDIVLMLDCVLQTRPADEERTEAVYDYYLDQVFSARRRGFGGVPANRYFIQRSSYGRGADLREKECVICLEEFDALAKVSNLPCSHVFHSKCIIRWLEKSHLCPLCRYRMPAAGRIHLQGRPSLFGGPSASQNRISGNGGHR